MRQPRLSVCTSRLPLNAHEWLVVVMGRFWRYDWLHGTSRDGKIRTTRDGFSPEPLHLMSSAQLTPPPLLNLFVFVFFLGLFFWGLTDWAGRCEIHMGDLVSGRALGGQRKLSDNTLMLIWRRESERYLSRG